MDGGQRRRSRDEGGRIPTQQDHSEVNLCVVCTHFVSKHLHTIPTFARLCVWKKPLLRGQDATRFPHAFTVHGATFQSPLHVALNTTSCQPTASGLPSFLNHRPLAHLSLQHHGQGMYTILFLYATYCTGTRGLTALSS